MISNYVRNIVFNYDNDQNVMFWPQEVRLIEWLLEGIVLND